MRGACARHSLIVDASPQLLFARPRFPDTPRTTACECRRAAESRRWRRALAERAAQPVREPVHARNEVRRLRRTIADRQHGAAAVGVHRAHGDRVAVTDALDVPRHHHLDRTSVRQFASEIGRDARSVRLAGLLERQRDLLARHRCRHRGLSERDFREAASGSLDRLVLRRGIEVRHEYPLFRAARRLVAATKRVQQRLAEEPAPTASASTPEMTTAVPSASGFWIRRRSALPLGVAVPASQSSRSPRSRLANRQQSREPAPGACAIPRRDRSRRRRRPARRRSRELDRARESIRRGLRHRAPDRIRRGRDAAGRRCSTFGGGALNVLLNDRDRCRPGKRRLPTQHLVQACTPARTDPTFRPAPGPRSPARGSCTSACRAPRRSRSDAHRPAASIAFASPKSATIACPFESRMLSGLMSRCTTLRAFA